MIYSNLASTRLNDVIASIQGTHGRLLSPRDFSQSMKRSGDTLRINAK